MRKCEWCGVTIVYKNGQARYCTSNCRVKAHRAAKRNPIPHQMLEHDRWIRRSRSKVPLTIHNTAASSTDPTTWTSYTEAAASTIGAGLGYVLGDGIGCQDLDHCLLDGQPTARALKHLSNYPTNYIEISPSGDGLHIWGTAPEQTGKVQVIDSLNIETYSTGRYITITSNVYQHGTLAAL